jgi:RimJ/RimL family protein N-acetyltransferase
LPEYPPIKLRREVYREDVEKLARWMRDERVTQYLNEDQDVDRQLLRLLRTSSLPLFSAHFSRQGTFFLVTLPDQGAIGFLRLIAREEEAEVVIVIGDRSQWGKGFGYRALLKGLKHAFFSWRKPQVIAKIHRRNLRSRQIFKKAGFVEVAEKATEIQYSLPIKTGAPIVAGV